MSDIVYAGLATKSDLNAFRAEMSELASRLSAQLAAVEVRLTRWWVGAILTQTAITVGLLLKVISLGKV